MAYSPTSNCNAANYNPNDILQVDPRDHYYAQAEQKAAYLNAQKTYGPTGDDYWKSQLAGAIQSQGSLSSIGGTVSIKSLQDEASLVRSKADELGELAADLQFRLFEPQPANACAQITEKDNPSTVEGNLQHANRVLSSAIYVLQNTLTKIGGR